MIIEDQDAPPPPPPVPLRSTPHPATAENWAFVLDAIGIENAIIPREGGFGLFVSDADRTRAAAALAAQDRENREPWREVVPPAPDQGRSAAGIAFALGIAAFFYVTGGRDGADPGGWFRTGSAIAEKIVHGEYWRSVTALSLHADPVHVLGNAVAGLIFLSALGRWLGGGMALLLTLLAGAGGNLLVAFAYGTAHNSVGASTATFGALGVLGGLQALRWLRGGGTLTKRRRALSVIAACLGVFAMLGVGERSDVLAHLAGLVVGLVLGVAAGRLLRLPLPFAVDIGAGLATLAVVAGSWWRAFA